MATTRLQNMRSIRSMRSMRFIPYFKEVRNKIFEASLDDIAAKNLLAADLFTCEIFSSGARTKPYFDIESYHDCEPTLADIKDQRDRVLKGIHRMFLDQPSKVEPNIVTATRHGKVFHAKKKTWQHKISHRAWVTNYSVEYTILSDVITMHGLSTFFDPTVYKAAEQLLSCIYCSKGADDRRQLTPEDANVPFHAYVVQFLTGEEEPFVFTAPKQSSEVPPTVQCDPRLAIVASHPVISLGSTATADTVVKYLSLLSKSRWDLRTSWCNIATCLKNDFGGTYKDDWILMSRISSKFDLEEAEKVWATVARSDFDGEPLTFRSIRHWASQDDPIGYAAVRASAVPAFVLENHVKGDRGLSEILAGLHTTTIKRCGKDGTFYLFCPKQCAWTKCKKDGIMNTLSHALEEALSDVETYYVAKSMVPSLDESTRKVYADAATNARGIKTKSRTFSNMVHMTALAAPMFHDDAFEQVLDSIPHLLGVKNGVVDLRTGTLRPRRPEDCIFTIVDVEYDPDANTDLMEEVVSQAMASPAKTRFMQKLLGYAITGEVEEEIFVVFTGSGRNGKGVISQLLAEILGLLYVDMNAGIISCDRQVSNIDAETSKLLGARVAVFKELNVGEKMKKDRVQLLSGGDGIPCCKKYCDAMTIKPRHLCILETNHMPEIDQVIPSIMERLICVHFPVSFTNLLPGEAETEFRRQCDPSLKARMRLAHSGALKWLVDGAVLWYASKDLKKNAPPEVKEFTRAYLLEQDLLLQFITQGCDIGPDNHVTTRDFLGAFNDWMPPGERAKDHKQVASAMQIKGFAKKVIREGDKTPNCFLGIALKTRIL